MDVKKAFWYLGSGVQNYGLLTTLLQQSGNGGTSLKARTIFNGITSGGKYQGSYSAAATYSQYDIIGYPTDSAPLRYRANQSTSAGQSPDTHPSKWDLTVGVEFLQDLGLGVYARYSLGVRNDAFIRMNGFDIGTYATSAFNRFASYYNDSRGASQISTSVTSMAIPTSHPTSRTLTIGAGLSITNSSSIGSSTDSFAIPTTHPTARTINMTAGLGLTIGNNVTVYGDANNFFVFVIARYNNTTGVAYGASTVHVGSGTFSSWTIKSERLIYIERTADVANKNLYALVQSYDSGTGSLVFNTVNNVGSTTNSDWTIRVGKEPFTVPGSNATRYNGNQSNNPFGTYGQWHSGELTGDRLLHNCTINTNGTGWLYIYGSGANDSSIPSDVTIDTYNGSSSTASRTVFSGLNKGTHTFLGISCVSPNVSSTNTRPYIDAGTTGPAYSFQEQYEYDVFTPTVIAGPTGGESFGEIAYRFRDTDGGDTAQWLPEHSNVLTTYATSKSLTIDSSSISLTSENDTFMLKFRDITTATLLQTLDVQHPQATGSMGTMNTTHTFNNTGLYYKVIQTWAQAGVIVTGYNNMVFLGDAWFNKVLCEDSQVITRPADNVSTNLTASQESQGSYLFYSTGADPLNDYVLALAFPNKTRDWRIGGSNRGTPFIQDFSGAANAKFYPFIYSGYSFAASEVMTVEGRLYLGNKGSLVLS